MARTLEAQYLPAAEAFLLKSQEEQAEAATEAAHAYKQARGTALKKRNLMGYGVLSAISGAVLLGAAFLITPVAPWVPFVLAAEGGLNLVGGVVTMGASALQKRNNHH